MPPLTSWFLPPPPGADPRQTLRWVRHMEIASAVVCLLLGIAFWGDGWWHWLLIGAGILGLAPWPGAAAILRKAETRPDILITDAERRRARGRRSLVITVPLLVAAGAGTGFLLDGWPAAIFMGGLMGIGAGLGAWWSLRWDSA